jgi:ABC-type antimicrobial peptide transport system permease subunit
MSEEELSDLYDDLIKSELYRSFQSEVIYSLGVTYSVNPDFIESYFDAHADKKCSVRALSFIKDGVEYPEDAFTTCGFSKNDPNKVQEHPAAHYLVNRGEIKIPYSAYNKIFGTNYSLENLSTFVPHDVTIRVHDRSIGDAAVIFEKTYKVVSILSSNIQMHEDDFYEIRRFSLKSFGLYLENNENVAETVALMNEREMVPKTIAFESVTGINKMLSIFIPLFKLIGGGLYAFVVIYLVNYAISNIKKNYFQIGVMRSFGAKSLDVGVIFITGVVLTGIAIVVLMIALEPLIVNVYNKILVESFSIVLNTYPHDISIVRLSPWTPVINSVLVLFTTFMSALISVLVLRKLKPIEIIRAKDNGGEVS